MRGRAWLRRGGTAVAGGEPAAEGEVEPVFQTDRGAEQPQPAAAFPEQPTQTGRRGDPQMPQSQTPLQRITGKLGGGVLYGLGWGV